MSEAGLKQRDLVQATGSKGSSVTNWFNGRTKNLRGENLVRAAALLQVSTDWLASGKGSMTKDPADASAPGPLLVTNTLDVDMPQYDTGGSMGQGVVLKDQPGIISHMTVSKDWLQKNVKGFTSANNLCIVTGFGDSMRGMFNPGDPLIVDTGVRSVEYDAVYFFRIDNEGFIKRLQRIPGRGIVAISENKAYQDWVIDSTMDFEVFGRVLKAWESKDF